MSGFNWVDELPSGVRGALLEKARLRRFASDITLYSQGDPVTEVFQIVAGEIRKCILTADGQEVLIYVYKPGDLIGDSSIADDEPYSVTIVTRGEVTLRAWSAKDFAQLRASHPAIESAISLQTSRRLRGALRLVEELLTQPVAARIASRVLWLADMQGAATQDVALSLSQAEIGQMVGSARQSVNKVVTELRRLNLIDTHYGSVVVKDPQGLRHFIDEHVRQERKAPGRFPA
ncbi:Crp/Fnr family transcriptional regulator [Pseudomonas sp. Au-Pse12]|uniref:Crp/Fnr family transcriptional regulator n=1 Tax=Pseudomonas sp. Au-Pse12 TaxID=2906459 RepID=UPI001E32827C|nr:Crp/Fnr family transcriptional regulator [Pseudomonas sp. Au-Pse12]MCE4052273.1 Crp/Fnr family transcriptional regulator [Pseudomonas sp. Au-Pse12]